MGGKLTPKPTNRHNVNDLQAFGGIGSVHPVEAAQARSDRLPAFPKRMSGKGLRFRERAFDTVRRAPARHWLFHRERWERRMVDCRTRPSPTGSPVEAACARDPTGSSAAGG